MKSGSKRWLAAGAVLAAMGLGVFMLSERGEKPRRSQEEEEEAPAFRGFRAGGPSSSPGTFGATPEETPAAVAAQVATAMSAWRTAILAKDPDTVLTLDRAFLGSPDRYLEALTKSAETDPEERVRAFSTRVLGKLKRPPLGGLFEKLLADKSPFVRQNAAWALGELATVAEGRPAAQHAVGELQKAKAKDPANDVRQAAKGALAKLE
jgi:hypothetical protein